MTIRNAFLRLTVILDLHFQRVGKDLTTTVKLSSSTGFFYLFLCYTSIILAYAGGITMKIYRTTCGADDNGLQYRVELINIYRYKDARFEQKKRLESPSRPPTTNKYSISLNNYNNTSYLRTKANFSMPDFIRKYLEVL